MVGTNQIGSVANPKELTISFESTFAKAAIVAQEGRASGHVSSLKVTLAAASIRNLLHLRLKLLLTQSRLIYGCEEKFCRSSRWLLTTEAWSQLVAETGSWENFSVPRLCIFKLIRAAESYGYFFSILFLSPLMKNKFKAVLQKSGGSRNRTVDH